MEASAWTPFGETPLWNDILAASVTHTVIFLNIKEISVLLKIRKRTPLEKFLLSLSIDDLLSALSAWIPGLLSFLEKYTSLLKIPQHIWIVIWIIWSLVSVWGVLTAVLHMVCISLDRFFAVSFPLRHKVYVTGNMIAASIALAWCIPFLVVAGNTISIFVQDTLNKKGFSYIYSVLARNIAMSLLIGNTVCTISYSMIAVTMFRRNRSKISDSNKRQKKTFILCFGIVCVFVCSTTPMMVAFVVPWNAPQQLMDAGTHLLAFNAVGTSTIYLVQYYANRRENSRRVIERARDVKNDSSKRDCSEAISE